MENIKIAIAGTGYVGLSLAVLLSQKNNVCAYDIIKEKVDMINNKLSPIKDNYIQEFLSTKKLNLKATTNYKKAFEDAEYIIVCTPTNYDEKKNNFDTSSIEDVIEKVKKIKNNKALIVIKSTIPIGYTENIRKKYKNNNIIFSPEFLREGKALYDNLHPSRIIVGEKSERAEKFANLLLQGSEEKNAKIKLMNSNEAEAVKLFANTYLAMRVSFFNELDTFAELKGFNSKDIIDGVSLDKRIGQHYNNPSFGYGGYCLPKDTKQLLANYEEIPQSLIGAIVKSNDLRKEHILKEILKRNPKKVGIYRLNMKNGSDNFRSSAIIDIMEKLKKEKIELIIYEPTIKNKLYNDYNICNDLNKFKKDSDIIIANRYNEDLEDVKEKIYSRDIFNKN